MLFLILKALHIIFVVTWFAGLFYIVRLFIYAAEASVLKDNQEKEILLKQYFIMQRRLWYGITWPSAILTFIFGTGLLVTYDSFPAWLALKLGCVFLLYFYHFSCHKIYTQQQRGDFNYTPFQLRVWNEVATLFLFAIVFIVILKHQITLSSIIICLIILAVLLFISVRVYAKRRKS